MSTEALIDTYCKAWSDADPVQRAHLLSQVWAGGATYTDPTVHARGMDEVLAHIAKVIARRPGSRVIRTSRIDGHHGMTRFGWRAVEADGNELPEGIYVAFLSSDGSKIERIIGSFGPLKQLRG